MNLIAFQGTAAVQEAIKQVSNALQSGCQRYLQRVQFRPTTIEAEVLWNPRLKYWTHLRMMEKNRPWLVSGIGEPASKPLSITLQFNPSFEQSPIQFGGLLARDESGIRYLCHTGKMGGGQKGLTKDGFLRTFADRVVAVRLPDGRSERVAVVGSIDGDRFQQHFAHFVHRAFVYKQSGEATGPAIPAADFSPESSGNRRSYSISRVDPICDHGLVVNSLKDLLESRKLRLGNDRQPTDGGKRDLFIVDDDKRQRVLFEVKTESELPSIYEGLGQLFYYAANSVPLPKRVLVLPDSVSAACKERIALCGVSVLSYVWRSGAPKFINVDSVLVGLR